MPPLSLQLCESDHKPVFMELELTVPSYIQETKHKHSLAMLAAVAADAAESEAGSGGGGLGRVSSGVSTGGSSSRAPSSALREVTSRGSFDTRPGAGPGREGPPAPVIALSMHGGCTARDGAGALGGRGTASSVRGLGARPTGRGKAA